jgi:hypothetical protein
MSLKFIKVLKKDNKWDKEKDKDKEKEKEMDNEKEKIN